MSNLTRLVLPWPDKRLAANSRAHWRAKADATKKARTSAHYIALEAGVKTDASAHLEFYFHPPDRRHRDLQNMPATQKAAIDGIADAMRVDDRHFRVSWPESWGDVKKGGEVVVWVSTGGGR